MRSSSANEVIDAGIGHEGFEAHDAAVGEGFHVVEVGGGEAAPEGEVGAGAIFAGGDFGVEARGVERGGRGVEGHVEKCGAAAGGEGGRAGGGAFPVKAVGGGGAGVVEVDVGVDHAGEDVEDFGVDGLFGGAGDNGGDFYDFAFGDGDGLGGDGVGEDDLAVADEEVVGHFGLAPAIGGAGPGGETRRGTWYFFGGVGDDDGDLDLVEECAGVGGVLGAVVIGDVEEEWRGAGGEGGAFEEGFVGAAVGVGHDGFEGLETGGGLARRRSIRTLAAGLPRVRCIEDVGGCGHENPFGFGHPGGEDAEGPRTVKI